MKIKILFLMPLLALSACSISMNPNSDRENEPMRSCVQDAKLQSDRSSELQKIVDADQKERADFLHLNQDQMFAMYNQDIERRKRVAEIFAEGCFQTARDYSNAALVFQHGNTADHFYQSYIWSKRAVALGDPSQKEAMANAIDRYLVNVDQKQLFATQAHADKVGGCYCMQEVEMSFPDARRVEYKGKTLVESLRWVDKMNQGKSCVPALECKEDLKPPLPGQFPGIW
jgi:hypothetical protein